MSLYRVWSHNLNISTSNITTASPASEFVGIDQTVTYAGQQLLTSSGIVDTGTTLFLLATGKLLASEESVG